METEKNWVKLIFNRKEILGYRQGVQKWVANTGGTETQEPHTSGKEEARSAAQAVTYF